MTAIPTNKSALNFENYNTKESVKSMLLSFKHKNILTYSHVDILETQKLLIKIHEIKENGSIKDLLYKTVFALLI